MAFGAMILAGRRPGGEGAGVGARPQTPPSRGEKALKKVPGVQDAAFQVPPSSPGPVPLPRGALRGGFVGTWLVSIALGALCAALADQHVIEPARAAIAWGWGSALTTVASLLAVRAVVSRQRAKVSRVQRAKLLLAGGRQSTAQIVAAVGYTDVPTFSRLFTRLVGESPARRRRARSLL